MILYVFCCCCCLVYVCVKLVKSLCYSSQAQAYIPPAFGWSVTEGWNTCRHDSQQPIPFRFLSSASNGISLSPLPYFNFLPFLSHMDVLISPCTLLEYNITADLTNLKITWESIAVCFVRRSEWKRKREHIAAHAVTRYPQHRNAAQSTGGRKKNETHVQDLFAISSVYVGSKWRHSQACSNDVCCYTFCVTSGEKRKGFMIL